MIAVYDGGTTQGVTITEGFIYLAIIIGALWLLASISDWRKKH